MSKVKASDPCCLCCCRPKSQHIARDLQCPETVYFIENDLGPSATRLEALQAQPVGEAHKTEYGWLIELDGPQGLSYCIGSKFDPDHAKALRFARREDAQAFCDQLSVAHTRIAEHGWD